MTARGASMIDMCRPRLHLESRSEEPFDLSLVVEEDLLG